MGMRKEDVKKLQTIENNTYRRILRAPSYTAIAALRGEIGASTMHSRIVKNKTLYYKSIRERKSKLLQEILEMQQERNFNWIRNLRRDMGEMGWNLENIVGRDQKDIKEMFRELDEERWRREMDVKSTFKIYRRYKGKMKEGKYYNNEESKILFRVRSNTLKLGNRERFVGGNVGCVLCGDELEDLEHFIMECRRLQQERNELVRLQRPLEEDRERVLGAVILCDESNGM